MQRTPTYFARCSGRGCSRSCSRSRSCSCSRGRREGFLRRWDGFLRRRNGLLNCHSTSWRQRRGGFLSITNTHAPEEEPDKQPQKQPYSERCEPCQDCPLQPKGPPP